MKTNSVVVALFSLVSTVVSASEFEVRLPTPVAVNLNHVIHDGEFFMAAGEGGTVLVSADGRNWLNHSPDFRISPWAKGTLMSIRKANGRWFAVGQPGPGSASATVFFQSDNRMDWAVNEFGSDRVRNDMAYGAGRYVWPINDGHFIESTTNLEGSSSYQTVNFPGSPVRTLFADDQFVVVGTNGLIATSSGGTNWTVRSEGTERVLLGLKYLEGAWYAVGEGLTVMRSTDGVVWTRVHGDDSYTPLYDIEYFKGTYFAPSYLGDVILVSTNGIDWESRSLSGAYGITGLATDQESLVAVGVHGLLLHSDDGLNWSGMAEPAPSLGYSRLASNGSVAVIRRRISETAWSEDGLNWHTVKVEGYVPFREIVWFKNAFFSCDDVNGKMLRSPDGRSWTVHADLPTATQSLSLRTAGERIFILENNGLLYSSVDGTNWETIQLLSSRQLRTVAHGNGTYLASQFDRIWVSSDGISFELVPSKPYGLGDPVYLHDRFYAANQNYVFTSSDGKAWLQLTEEPFPQWFAGSTMCAVADTLYLVGGRGLVASSINGIDWIYQDTGLATGGTNVVKLNDSILIGFSDSEVVQSREASPVAGLANISVRGFFPRGDSVQIGGFVMEGSSSRKVIARGIGPSIDSPQLKAISDPSLSLFQGETRLLENDDWEVFSDLDGLKQRSLEVGAFSLDAGSKDSALVIDLGPGAYTAVVRTEGGDSAVGLVELFDAGSPDLVTSRIVNLSARGTVESGAEILIAGFVVREGRPAKVLIRGIGPGLRPFGVTGFLSRPQLNLFNGGQSLETASDWGQMESAAALSGAMLEAGAFPLDRSGRDAAMLAYLEPGVYTVHLSGLGGPGTGLIEIFLLD